MLFVYPKHGFSPFTTQCKEREKNESRYQPKQKSQCLFIGVEVLCFIIGTAGAAVLLDYSTYDSKIQPLIRQRMRYLISESQNEHAGSVLRMVQETIGCCGADGANDYLQLLKPLPTECRDTVTGNAFYHGCVEELTWFLEEKAGWLSALALAGCFIHDGGTYTNNAAVKLESISQTAVCVLITSAIATLRATALSGRPKIKSFRLAIRKYLTPNCYYPRT
ncbi:hypothetical protein Cfor_01234 [Coptotermes formosanus]|uniref:Tetraspanin n=1 Tax=Coptotermes formosanus TaxID=36987 RepID=A0A6L2PAE7_COPFO|nr:hypothetical protein Cfor_01234 [Coptotermes formosanus]